MWVINRCRSKFGLLFQLEGFISKHDRVTKSVKTSSISAHKNGLLYLMTGVESIKLNTSLKRRQSESQGKT